MPLICASAACAALARNVHHPTRPTDTLHAAMVLRAVRGAELACAVGLRAMRCAALLQQQRAICSADMACGERACGGIRRQVAMSGTERACGGTDDNVRD
eukprot:1250494-Rhodomonas_salina.1